MSAVRGDIENVLSRWCWAMDERSLEALGAVYTGDARLISRLPGREPSTIDGRSSILEHFRATWARVPVAGVKHIFSALEIQSETASEVNARSYFHSFRIVDGRPVLSALGHQLVRLRLEPDGWRIAERTHQVDGWLAG